jgi:hypothetical protein
MTTGLSILIGVVLGVPLGVGLCALLVVSREAEERAKIEQWSEYFGEQL